MLVCVCFVTNLDADVMAKKLNVPLQSHHAIESGLRICECSASAISVVVTVIC